MHWWLPYSKATCPRAFRVISNPLGYQRVRCPSSRPVPADVPRMIAMLHSVLWTMDSGDDGWRGYVVLMLDAISVDHRRSLPPAAALRFAPCRATV